MRMSELNKAKNNQGAKGYRDDVISKLEIPEDIEYENFPKQSAKDMRADAQDPATPDYSVTGSVDNPADGYPQADPEIEHFPEAKKHSFSHSIDESELRQNKGMGKVAKTDDTAKGSQ